MKLLAFYDHPHDVCCRYRIRPYVDALTRAGWTSTIEGLSRRLPRLLWQLIRVRSHDAVLLQRRLLPGPFLGLLRRRSRRLIFDFDDAVSIRDSYDPRGHDCPLRARRFARVVGCADRIIAGNDYLADLAATAGAPPERIAVIPDCLVPARYPMAAHLPRQVGTCLVWIGSGSTLQGLQRQAALWDSLADAVPGLRLRVICDTFPRFDRLPVEAVPWRESSEAADLLEGDIGIAWLPDDRWSPGKCGLKILQYQAAGLPVVANRVGMHRALVRNGDTGFLADTPEEWRTVVTTLAGDPALRRRLGRAGRRHVEEGYAVDAWADQFVAAVSP
jgi:glycosyltransferase involved in cell wall biosynthesis